MIFARAAVCNHMDDRPPSLRGFSPTTALQIPRYPPSSILAPSSAPISSLVTRHMSLFQHRLMELVPIIEVVQVHRIFRCGRVVRHVASTQHILARVVIVNVTAHRRVMLLDRPRRERFGVLLHPRFKLGIGRFLLLDAILPRLLLEPERRTSHRIESSPDARITRSEFTRRFERDFLPKPRQMQNAEWPGCAGTDQWNICVTHND